MSEESLIAKWSREDPGRANALRDAYREVIADLLSCTEEYIRAEDDRRYESGKGADDRSYALLHVIKSSVKYAHELAKNSQMAGPRRIKMRDELEAALDDWLRLCNKGK